MPATYEPIATTTLGSAASSITFSSIPNTYTDLRLVWNGKATVASSYIGIEYQFNSDTSTNYSYIRLRGNGTNATSNTSTSTTAIPPGFTVASVDSTNGALAEIDIFSYAGSTYKTTLNKGSNDRNGSGTIELMVGLWRSTSAITSIKIQTTGGDMATGTTATLYGILKA